MDKRQGCLKNGPAPRRMLGPRSASPFVGRNDELGRLGEALSRAVEGQGEIIFLTGEPGIGKTRLAREALALAKTRGFTTLEGHAHSLEIGLSYAPLIEAFRPLLRSLASPTLRTLVSDLPSLGRLFEGLGLPLSSFPLEGLGDPGLEKTRLFEAMSRLLERLTQRAPVALFVDDVHRADPATLELLYYLGRGMVDQRVLLLASYSTDAMDAPHGLQALVGSLWRDGLAEEIIIPRLEPDAVDKMVQAILGGEAPRDLLSLLDARAGGTPLFVEALLSALIDTASLVRTDQGWVLKAGGAATLPPRVRGLIAERLERLEPTDRRVIKLIAAMGNSTTHAILRAASGLGEEDLIESLRRLIATGLVAEETDWSDSAYYITHPLIQEVAYAELPGAARRRAHLAAIRALESVQGKDDVNLLAYHYRGAGVEAAPSRSLEVLLAAGERAQAIHANEEAAQHYAAALAILREGRGGFPVGAVEGREDITSTLPALLERLGDVWERTGKHGAAFELWNEALVLLSEGERSSDNVAVARLHNRLAEAEASQGHFDVAKAHLTAGSVLLVEGLDGRGPSKELADLYVTRCYMLIRLGDVAGLAESTAELLCVAERLASPLVQAKANLVAAVAGLDQNDVPDAQERAQHALTVAEQNHDLALCYTAHSMLQVVAMRLGEHRLIRYHAQWGLALAQRFGAPSYEVIPRLRLAYADFLSGAWDESLLNVMEAVSLARRVGNPRDLAYSLAERAMLLALRGEPAEAEASISEVRTTFGDEPLVDRTVFGLVDIAETAIALERGETKRALAIARDFVRPSALAAAPAHLTNVFMSIGLMLLAEVQAAAGEAEGALETADRLRELGPPGAPYLSALAFRAEGLARQALGQQEAATACLARAYEMFTSLEVPFEAARSLLERAILVGAERPELSAEMARQSLAIFKRLGARRHADRARQLLRGFGISPSAVHQPQSREGLLSARELEVARLVAEGFTTAQIAKRMVLSRHTINSHLVHIYRRLKIGSRSALTRYVVQAGLLSPAHQGS